MSFKIRINKKKLYKKMIKRYIKKKNLSYKK